jgi:6,7-dimethyl-8-ribityllumazine synthase
MKGTVRALEAAGATYDIITVPGSLEVPAAIAMALDAKGRRYDGAVALGCVIRGDTIHFEIVSEQSARGLMDLSIARKVPLGNGILTVDTEAQAWARAKPDEADKGGDAARAALAMLAIKRDLAKGKRR